ncbi:MAG: CxxC-x17-CxxC domain-containing protein [Candidatus Bathyarchaeia archaeon]
MPTKTYKTTCANCGKEIEIPFQPDSSKPQYCRDCWAKRRQKIRY